MAKASQDMKTGDISDARDSEDEEVEIRYNGAPERAAVNIGTDKITNQSKGIQHGYNPSLFESCKYPVNILSTTPKMSRPRLPRADLVW